VGTQGDPNADAAAVYEATRAIRVKVDDWFNRSGSPNTTRASPPRKSPSRWSFQPSTRPGRARRGPPVARARQRPPGRARWPLSTRSPSRPSTGAEDEISSIEWEQLRPRYAAYEAWVAAKAGAAVEKLGLARVEGILGGDSKAGIEALIAKDKKLAAQADAVADAVRIAHYKRDLHRLLRNFVNFNDFYERRSGPSSRRDHLHEAGAAVSACSCDDHASRPRGARSSYRMYHRVLRPEEGPADSSMKIAACFTQGDSDYLMPVRNGVFLRPPGFATGTRPWCASWKSSRSTGFSRRTRSLASSRSSAEVRRREGEGSRGAREAALERASFRNPAACGRGQDGGIIAALGVDRSPGALFGVRVRFIGRAACTRRRSRSQGGAG